MMLAADGSGWSVSVQRGAPLVERVAQAADQVQDWSIELQLWGSAPTNWPQCPGHPDSHPMQARVVKTKAVWVGSVPRTRLERSRLAASRTRPSDDLALSKPTGGGAAT